MEVLKENQLELAVCGSTPSFQGLLDSQQELFHSQIDQLQNIVFIQCKLTGVNPLSQEMAAGALSIKIGKRPRDLLNPKAVKYMQAVFSIKDAITKKESREISALFGVTVTQVRDFFTSQRSRVRKFVRLSTEKALRSNASKEVQDGVPMTTDPAMPVYPVPLNSVGPPSSEEGPSCSTQDETLPVLDDPDRNFVDNILSLMRKEEMFSGQVKLMEWILQIQNSSVLHWFLTKGGVMILATWLSQAASEEQTSVLHVILEVLCHLPLHKALPVHMSAILQSVNRLRFYRASDISIRARNLLSRWSKIFARSQAMKKSNAVKSSTDAQNEMLLKQSISDIMDDESWESKIDASEDTLAPSLEGSENFRKLESPQLLKLLPASADDSSKKLIRGVSSSQTRERRKVLMVEQPGQKQPGRSFQVARSVPATQGRPLSADDIQKAKLRAQFMQSKYGKSGVSSGEGHQVKTEGPSKFPSSQARTLLSASKARVQPRVEECKDPVMLLSKVSIQQEAPLGNKVNSDLNEPLSKKFKRVQVQIPWQTPADFSFSTLFFLNAEMRIHDDWRVGMGENSKEVEVQRNRIRREKETIYRTSLEIPHNPKEPWDSEMEYDDTLTPEIPTEQLPDPDGAETVVSPQENEISTVVAEVPESSTSQISNGSVPEPDLELLAVLLKNPELVFALTSGQGGSLSSEQTVKLLDMIKSNGVASLANLTTGLGRNAPEENVQVSLPSPTPSSDPVTSGWSKNPFSRQSITANREPVAVSIPSQEKFPASNLVRHELSPPIKNIMAQQPPPPPSFPPLSHQALPQYPLPHNNNRLTPPVIPPVHQIATSSSETVRNLKNIPPSSSSLPSSMRVETSTYVKTAPVSDMVNRNPVSHPSTSMLPPRAQPQRQREPRPAFVPEPMVSTMHSWREINPGLASNPHPLPNQNNYNSFVRGAGPMHHGPPRDRDEYMGEEDVGFESWSPERSPFRSNEYMSGLTYREPRMNMGHNHRSRPGPGPGPGPDRSRPWNSSSEYRDYNRQGNRRPWRDGRR
ncbi:homeobox protein LUMINIDEPENDENS isoform X1 [Camellia sinensis]|uniref:homeobox protein LUMINIDEPENDENS isoform X1 n=1 Tax=Camellia sinensis TaxID=4442 RepID=UPI001035E669|nr:homeobox protein LUMINIDEPENDENS isoform X1 [Camellia sinensis]